MAIYIIVNGSIPETIMHRLNKYTLGYKKQTNKHKICYQIIQENPIPYSIRHDINEKINKNQ